MDKRIKDLCGRQFNRLIVVSYHGKLVRGSQTRTFWNCICQCGNIKKVWAYDLVTGKNGSCGCLEWENLQRIQKERITHGKSRGETLKMYNIWKSIVSRCTNPEDRAYPNYGGRGISVCEKWKNSIDLFIEDMGDRPSLKHSIDRIDNNGNYEPSNCRWATQKEQMRNTRSNVCLEYKGEIKCVSEWAEELGVNQRSLRNRIKRWGDIEKAFTTPVKYKKKGSKK